MNAEEFEEVFEQRVQKSRTVLVAKAREYATDHDRLHNFKKAAQLTESTPEEALWGFLVKHLVSVSDMVTSGDVLDYTAAQWDEKLGDTINYLILLEAQIIETRNGCSQSVNTTVPSMTEALRKLGSPAPTHVKE